MGELLLEFVVFDEAPLECVGEQHLTGTEPSFPDNGGGINIENTDFAGKNNQTVGSNHIASRPKPIPVQCCPNKGAIGENKCCGAIPRLHQHGVVFVEVSNRLVHVGLVFPGLWHHHHDRVGQGAT